MSGQEESDGIDVEEIRETDRNRRQTTMTSTGAIEANQLRTGTLTSFWRDFISQNARLVKVEQGIWGRWTTSCRFTEKLGTRRSPRLRRHRLRGHGRTLFHQIPHQHREFQHEKEGY